MKTLKESNENEMILEFLKGEYNSNRFNEKLTNILNELKIKPEIILNGKLNNEENTIRKEIMSNYRGYPNKELFNNFPFINSWKLVKFNQEDINNIYYINYDYWNLLSNNTSKPLEAAKTINKGIEIYNVSNKPFLDGVNALKENTFPPIILITCNEEKYLIIEGHSRMTIYGLEPFYFENTLGFIGYCSKEDMEKYDKRML